MNIGDVAAVLLLLPFTCGCLSAVRELLLGEGKSSVATVVQRRICSRTAGGTCASLGRNGVFPPRFDARRRRHSRAATPLLCIQGDCSSNNSSSSEERTVSRCEVEEVARAMRKRKRPVELKVEAEGKLYSIPDGVKMVRPGFEGKKGKWWKRISRKTKDSSDGDGGSNDMPKPPACLEEVMATGAADGNDVAPGSQSGDGDIGGEGPAAGEDLRSAVERACQICFGQNYSTVMLPCGHGGLCWECGLHIYALKEECPMCRTKIELLVPLDNENKRFEGGREFVPSSTAFGKDGKTL